LEALNLDEERTKLPEVMGLWEEFKKAYPEDDKLEGLLAR
jgi:hypothetical protein